MSAPLTSFISDSTPNGPIFAQRKKTDYAKHEYADIKDKYLMKSYDQEKQWSTEETNSPATLAESSKRCQSHVEKPGLRSRAVMTYGPSVAIETDRADWESLSL